MSEGDWSPVKWDSSPSDLSSFESRLHPHSTLRILSLGSGGDGIITAATDRDMRKERENTTRASRDKNVAWGPGVYMPALNVPARHASSNRTRTRFRFLLLRCAASDWCNDLSLILKGATRLGSGLRRNDRLDTCLHDYMKSLIRLMLSASDSSAPASTRLMSEVIRSHAGVLMPTSRPRSAT